MPKESLQGPEYSLTAAAPIAAVDFGTEVAVDDVSLPAARLLADPDQDIDGNMRTKLELRLALFVFACHRVRSGERH